MNGFPKIKLLLARASAAMLLIAILWGCGGVPPVSEMAPPSSRLPFVAVLLDNVAREHGVAAVDDGQLSIDCYKGDQHSVYFSRKEIRIKASRKTLDLYNSDGYLLDDDIDRILVSPRGKERILAYDGKMYRGLLEMTASSGQIVLVNLVYVEDYLKGVVALEIGPSQEDQIEAVKAQAIAARTYAMAHLGQFGPDAGYDLKADVADQVYGGVAAETDLVSRAVEATTGQVAVYKGKLINAYYHSTCGGATDDIEDVWDKDPQPYLVSVSDHDACSISKYFSWREQYTADQIVLRLNQYLTQERGEQVNVGRLSDVRVGGRTPGGRVASIIFETTSGHYIFNKEKVRWVIKQSDAPEAILRSARFSLEVKKNGAGDVTQVIFNGGGWGHGVGMCQMGAKGLSAKGVACDSIISLYYQGTTLKKLY